ncbi:MAG TPA: HEPN domain-containing protein [Candidatus Lokiarchaeia archaeon]|nr:HEPN domain-containing protein [Candidatus Lokiarchaeia archaeon]
MTSDVVDLIKKWVEHAQNDLNAAKKLLEEEGFIEIACYHAQQAAEKYLKAYLIWLGVEYPKTHALEKLIDIIGQEDPDIEDLKVECAKLTPYAVAST